MDRSIIFFINGFMDQETYTMRFLTESKSEIEIEIEVHDEYDNIVSFYRTINGLSLIKIECADFITTYNWQGYTFKNLIYSVNTTNEKGVFTGSFMMFLPEYLNTVNIASIYNSYDNNDTIWHQLETTKPDVILHIGNQINSVAYERKVGYNKELLGYEADEIKQYYADLYRQKYSDSYISNILRNTLNIMVPFDTDVIKNIGKKINCKNQIAKLYFEIGMMSAIKYQLQLTQDFQDKNSILTGNKSVYFTTKISNMKIVVLDSKIENFFYESIFSNRQKEWLSDILEDCDEQKVIIISSKPFGTVGRTMAKITKSYDELLHPKNFNNTLTVLDILKSSGKDVLIFSAANFAFCTDINLNKEKVAFQSVTSPMTDKSLNDKCFIKKFLLKLKYRFPNSKNIKFGKRNQKKYGNSFSFLDENGCCLFN